MFSPISHYLMAEKRQERAQHNNVTAGVNATLTPYGMDGRDEKGSHITCEHSCRQTTQNSCMNAEWVVSDQFPSHEC